MVLLRRLFLEGSLPTQLKNKLLAFKNWILREQ